MESATLEQINSNLLLLKREIERVANIVEESYLEIDEEIDIEMEKSRKRKTKELLSHEEMKKEFDYDND